ncbi:MAG TPA: radical SAM protein [Thermoanaerobaculia bacterium]|nr:radical SAM protein [Thermoanaerobaculia bacterium]
MSEDSRSTCDTATAPGDDSYADLCSDDNFYIHRIEDGHYLVLSVAKVRPILINETGKQFFDLLLECGTREACHARLFDEDVTDFDAFCAELDLLEFLDREPDKRAIDPERTYSIRRKIFYLQLTNRCNLNCTYCFNVEQRRNVHDLPLEQMKVILDKILPVAKEIKLTGGEPLLYRDLAAVIEHIRAFSEDTVIDLMSNGMSEFSRLDLETLRKVNSFCVSCDRLHGDCGERIGFRVDKFQKNIDYLIKNGWANKVQISSVATAFNEEDLKEVRAYCAANGFFHFVAARCPRSDADDEFTQMPTIESMRRLQRTGLEGTGGAIPVPPKTAIELRDRCGAANTTIGIGPEGDCYPCQGTYFPRFKLGNLLSQRLTEVVDTPLAEEMNRITSPTKKAVCSTCKLRHFCGGPCIGNLYPATGDPGGFSPALCHFAKRVVIDRLVHDVKFDAAATILEEERVAKPLAEQATREDSV